MEGKGKQSSFASIRSAIYDKEERKQQYQAHIRGLNAYDRHNKFLKDYVGFYGNEESRSEKAPVRTDQDTLREGYRFIRTEEDDMDTSWEQRLVKRYYDKLFKEYCIADMTHYKSGKVGLRWRTKKEVVSGKGQFICGNKHCNEKDGLTSYEVNFSYMEAGESKQALVKLVNCQRCSEKLHYKRRKEKDEEEKSKTKLFHKRKRDDDDDLDQDDDHSDQDANTVERKKGKGSSSSGNKTKLKDDSDDDFDSFLEGMFP